MRLLALLAAWCVCTVAHAQLALDRLTPELTLTSQLSVLEDPAGKLTFEHVSGARFVPNARDELSFGFSYSALWVRFAVRNAGTKPVRWLLELDEPTLDSVDLYVRHLDGRVEVHHAGDAIPFQARELGAASPVFALTSAPGDAAECYLRVQSDDVLRAPIRVWQPAAYAVHHERVSLVQWFFYGALLMLALYNLGVFATVRQLEHLYYALASISMWLVMLCLNGQQSQFLFTGLPRLCARLGPLAMALAALFIALFMSAVVRRLSRRGDVERYFRAAVRGTFLLLAFCALAPTGLCFRVLAAVLFTLGASGPVLLYLLGSFPMPELTLYRRSWIALCVAIPIAVLRYSGLLPAWPGFVWALPIGLVVHGVTSSLALASLAGSMRRALSTMNAELQSNVEELQLALARAEQANDASNRATKAKDEFVATMSHELRTPLNAIINIPQGLINEFASERNAVCSECRASFLLDEADVIEAHTPCASCQRTGTLVEGRKIKFRGDEARYLRFLQKIERSGQHLLQMVNGVLDYSKLEAGRFELALAPVDLDALIREVCDQMIDLAQRKGIAIELDYTPSPRLPLLADMLRLKQVLINLIANAIKFSEPNTTVSVRWESAGAEGETIAIEDRGIGIAAEHHERIFTSFEQVHQGDTRKYGGTGLGLSISRSLVRMHGGELSVRSELGKGSTFVVRLPRIGTLASGSAEMSPPDNLHGFDTRPRAAAQ
ncbi:MAG TPA: sensor histidine kinase [Polyangiales bacterium]|nr:sensor histidine kinase [Polyangiales bacterium]